MLNLKQFSMKPTQFKQENSPGQKTDDNRLLLSACISVLNFVFCCCCCCCIAIHFCRITTVVSVQSPPFISCLNFISNILFILSSSFPFFIWFLFLTVLYLYHSVRLIVLSIFLFIFLLPFLCVCVCVYKHSPFATIVFLPINSIRIIMIMMIRTVGDVSLHIISYFNLCITFEMLLSQLNERWNDENEPTI